MATLILIICICVKVVRPKIGYALSLRVHFLTAETIGVLRNRGFFGNLIYFFNKREC